MYTLIMRKRCERCELSFRVNDFCPKCSACETHKMILEVASAKLSSQSFARILAAVYADDTDFTKLHVETQTSTDERIVEKQSELLLQSSFTL